LDTTPKRCIRTYFLVSRRNERTESQNLTRIEEIEAYLSESEDPVGELLFLCRDDSATVRGQAYRALVEFWQDKRVLPFLQRTLEHEPDSHARGLVCIGLGRFLDTASEEGVLEADFRPDPYTPEELQDITLARHVYDRIFSLVRSDDTDLEVRRRGLEALGSFAYRPEVAELVEKMYQRPEESAQVSALFAMGRSGLDKLYRKRLIKHLDDARLAVQFEAIKAVEWWKLRAALPFLRKIVLDKENPNRGFALEAYMQCDPPPEKARDLQNAVHEMMPDAIFEEVIPDIEDRFLDALELGDGNEDIQGLFDNDPLDDPES